MPQPQAQQANQAPQQQAPAQYGRLSGRRTQHMPAQALGAQHQTGVQPTGRHHVAQTPEMRTINQASTEGYGTNYAQINTNENRLRRTPCREKMCKEG